MLNSGKSRNGKKSATRSVAAKIHNSGHVQFMSVPLKQPKKQFTNNSWSRNEQLPIAELCEATTRRSGHTEPLRIRQPARHGGGDQVGRHETKKRRQGPLPGAANQWYALSNRVHRHGTTIEMMYTGLSVPQPRQQSDVRAIPGVTHVTMELPAGVLPNIKNSTPDMPSLLNAMDFFKYPQDHLPAPEMGPSTSIQVIPKDSTSHNSIDIIEVVPLSCTRAAPLKRTALNVAFQSYSLMQLELDEGQSQQPGRLVIDAEISPTYLLSTHQQLRLQAAVIQENMPLADALLPIVEDLYEEHEKLHRAGLRLMPAPRPLPYGTMRFYYIEPPIFGASKSSSSSPPQDTRTPSYIVQVPRGQTMRKKRHLARDHINSDYIDIDATIMALDAAGNYRPMMFSEWGKLKRSQQFARREMLHRN